MVKARIHRSFSRHVRHRRTLPQRPVARARARPADRRPCSPRCPTAGLTAPASPSMARAGAARPSSRSAARPRPRRCRDCRQDRPRLQPTPASRCTTPMPWSPSPTGRCRRLVEWLRQRGARDRRRRPRPRMELYKEVGLPETVAERFGLAAMRGHPRHRPYPHGDRSRR